MIVVSDSSPLITLSKIDYLQVLPALYETVHITPEVYAEVAVTGAGLWGAADSCQGGMGSGQGGGRRPENRLGRQGWSWSGRRQHNSAGEAAKGGCCAH